MYKFVIIIHVVFCFLHRSWSHKMLKEYLFDQELVFYMYTVYNFVALLLGFISFKMCDRIWQNQASTHVWFFAFKQL